MDSRAHAHCVYLIFQFQRLPNILDLVCVESRKGHEQRWHIVVYRYKVCRYQMYSENLARILE